MVISPKPWLWIPPQLAHDLSPWIMNAVGRLPRQPVPVWRPLDWRGLHFPNRLGTAGGVDKNALGLAGWWQAGAGFLEIGTVTPKAQPGNSGLRVGRDPGRLALWNRLGFPNSGADAVSRRLHHHPTPRPTPVFANIGKNATTPLEKAADDYVTLISSLESLVDGFIVNISSPNTQGLRELLKPSRLSDFLAPLAKRFRETGARWLLKISPDIDEKELETILRISTEAGTNGWVLTNTSQGLRENLSFPNEGGVSGKPLADRSRFLLQSALRTLGSLKKDRLVISVGGVLSPEDVEDRLELGADLVEVYAALIFSGPFFFRQVAKWQQKRK